MYEDFDEVLQAEPDNIEKILSGEAELSDPIQIEDVLLEINRLQRDVGFYKKLKQRRVQPITDRINDAESKIERLRKAALDCMIDNNTSKLDFPEVAKISQRKVSGSWDITDEKDLTRHLEDLELLDDVAQKTWKFDKRKLKKLLDELKEANNLCQGVERGEDRMSLSISFYDQAEAIAKEVENEKDAARWAKVNHKSSDDFDQIAI